MFTRACGRRHVLTALSAVPLLAASRPLFAAVDAAPPDQPFFRFVPGAYRNKLCFAPADDRCDVCSKACVWKYTGTIYAVNEPGRVCARCIADGSLARHFGATPFQMHDSDVAVPPPLWDEINHRTPGIPTFNPILWPVIDAVPLAFVAAGESDDFPTGPDVDRAVAMAWNEIGSEDQGVSGYVLLFRQIDGHHYRAVLDFD